MVEQNIYLNVLPGKSEAELLLIIEECRKKMRSEKERMVSEVLSRVAGLPNDKKIIEINKELGREIFFVPEEMTLGAKRFSDIIVNRIMNKELCPASEFGLCIGGLKNLQTKETCNYCDGHGTAEWDNY